MASLLIDIALALVTGVGLWAVLPRGVVLTRSARTQNWRGEPVYDTWELRNDSALPIRLTSVAVMGIGTMDEKSGRFRYIELSRANERTLGVELEFDDAHLRTTQAEQELPWKRVIVPPGDTLRAKVPNNTTLRVKYRRAGVMGILERREVVIHGYV